MALGFALFVVSYVLIAGPRLRLLPLDRPAGALLGAVAFVVSGILSPADALSAINGDTLLLLFGLMGVGAVLAQQGLLDEASAWALRTFATPSALLGALVWGAGLLSALITNDAVCVLATPLVVTWIKRRGLPPFPFLLALATAANTGSVATVVGNPQNLLCATLGGLGYRDYLLHMLPVAVAALAINHAVVAWILRRALAAEGGRAPGGAGPEGGRSFAPASTWPRLVPLLVLAGSVGAYLSGAHLATTAVAAFALLLVARGTRAKGLWELIDWTVLVFFAALFVIVEGFVRSGGAEVLLSLFPLSETEPTLVAVLKNALVFMVGANFVSNVPFILVIQPKMQTLMHPTFWWRLLAMASTFAGNMTLLGSVANIIVAQGGSEVGGLGFWRYLKVGLPLALVTTLVGALWLLAWASP